MPLALGTLLMSDKHFQRPLQTMGPVTLILVIVVPGGQAEPLLSTGLVQ
jgi:hypothetical protein